MSHFATIYDVVRCQYFDFGKCVARSSSVYREAQAAAELGLFEDFMSAFPPASEGWGVDPKGAARLFSFMEKHPSGDFVLDLERGEAPMHMLPHVAETRWWPCVGCLYSPVPRGRFDDVGYMHFRDGDPLVSITKSRGGLLSQAEFDVTIANIRRTGRIEAYRIHGLDLKGYK